MHVRHKLPLAGIVAGVIALALAVAPAAGARVLRVGTYHGVAGQYTSIQAAVNAAHPGDWILIAPGDYKTTSSSAPKAAPDAPAGILITKPRIYLRGMNRNTVIVDGTKPGSPRCSKSASAQNFGPKDKKGALGLNGIMVWKAANVWVQNLTVCNFLGGSGGDVHRQRDLVERRRRQRQDRRTRLLRLLPDRDQHVLQGREDRGGVRDLLEQLGRRHLGSELREQLQRLGLLHRRLPAGLPPDDQQRVGRVQRARVLGLELGRLDADRELALRQQRGRVRHQQPERRRALAAERGCPAGVAPPVAGAPSCWVLSHNMFDDNNNPNVPAAGSAAAGPVGTGMSLSGGRNDTVMDNLFENNGAWGQITIPYLDSGKPCTGGILGALGAGTCLFDESGDAVLDNTFTHNGFFGNPSNGDLALTNFEQGPTDCFSGNVEQGGGAVTTTPANLEQTYPTCNGQTVAASDSAAGPFTNEVLCDAQVSLAAGAKPPCQPTDHYPRRTKVVMHPLPKHLATMPNPCAGVPANPWCRAKQGMTVVAPLSAALIGALAVLLAAGAAAASARVLIVTQRQVSYPHYTTIQAAVAPRTGATGS